MYAFHGIRLAFKEVHFIIEMICAVIVISAGFIFQITSYEWLAILICCGAVLSLEVLNTAIEKMVDEIHPDIHPTAKIIKDLAAGAVLIMCIFSAVVGVFVFWKYIF